MATINSSGFSTATGAGSTLFHATWNVDYWYLENIETGFCNSTPDTADCTASCTVQPQIIGPNALWWFSGENPQNYATSTTLTASSSNSTLYSWEIIGGTDQLRFDDNSTLKVTSSNEVTVKTINFSTSPNQIRVKVTINGLSSAALQMTVRTPYQLEPFGEPMHLADSQQIFKSIYKYRILDQFGNLLPFDVPFNEKFVFPITVDYPGMNWEQSVANGLTLPPDDVADLMTPGRFAGQVPVPTFPGLPLSNVRVFHRLQEFYVGSELVGIGRRVQGNTQQYYIDHGAHENVVTPYPNP
ncbi:MAG: hypothetical protein U0Z53_19570 [Blastocatellia bacterium]